MILKSAYSHATGKSVSLAIDVDWNSPKVTFVVADDYRKYRKRSFDSFADAVEAYDTVVGMIEKKEK